MVEKNNFTSLLERYLKNTLAKEQIEQMANYLLLMIKWNKVYNLTAIKEAKEMVIRHVLDSLAINDELKGSRIIDVGTGAGLPGIPLAIINSDKHFSLLDSNNKKTRFLTQVVIDLNLKNVEVISSRVENYSPDSCFDTVLTRAFGSINDMLLQTRHLCCRNGIFLAMKGVYPEEELNNLPKGFVVKSVKSMMVPELEAQRHCVTIEFAETE